MIKNLLLISLIGAISGQAQGRQDLTIEVDGMQREYSLVVPENTSKKPMPVLFLYHGFSGNPIDILRYSGFETIALKEKFIVVSPGGSGRPLGWNSGVLQLGRKDVNDYRFFEVLYDRVSQRSDADLSRVYVAGHSNGAMMTNALAGKYSEKIAAIGSVAGIVGAGRVAPYRTVDKPISPVSAVFIHGDNDQVVAYGSDSKAMLKGMPIEEGAKFWAESIGIKNKPKIEEKTGYRRFTYSSKKNRVELWSLAGWGHEWSNSRVGPINSAQVIWDFVKNFQKKPPVLAGPKLRSTR